MKTTFVKLTTACAAALLSAGAFAAGPNEASMGVSASIAPECSVGNVVALTFGTLSMLSGGGRSTSASGSTGGGSFDAICTAGSTTPTLTFTSANSSGSDFRLKGTTDQSVFIVYTLAEAVASTAIAYNTAAAFGGFSADGSTHSLVIKGSIAASEKDGKANQDYSDTITITATYGV